MENAHSASRFDWIGWLATIPGVPADWGQLAPRHVEEVECLPEPDDLLVRLAA